MRKQTIYLSLAITSSAICHYITLSSKVTIVDTLEKNYVAPSKKMKVFSRIVQLLTLATLSIDMHTNAMQWCDTRYIIESRGIYAIK